MRGYDAFVAPSTSNGKNIAPRVAALLDVMQVSDILSVESADTFTRPIYAGNAIATVQSSDAKKVITVRGTAFEKAARAARTGRNPRTGEAVEVTGKAVPYFKPGKELRERVNGGPLQSRGGKERPVAGD